MVLQNLGESDDLFRYLKDPQSHLSSDRPVTKSNSADKRLYALLIGINTYDNTKSLRGTLADVRAMRDYLVTDIGVSKENISILLNKSASRAGILSAIEHIRDDPEIQKGDPILIFYAGLGTEVRIDSEAEVLPAIVPQDYSEKVPPIPLRTITALLNEIAATRSSNITLVMDCSFSVCGSLTEIESSTLARTINLGTPLISFDTDAERWLKSPATRVSELPHNPTSFPVVIAACSASEMALETRGHGCFTTALITLLRAIPPNELHCADIIRRIGELPGQNPSCEGAAHGTYPFGGKIFAKERLCFDATVSSNAVLLRAGALNGVRKGDEFSIHTNEDKLLENPVGHAAVEGLNILTASLRPMAEAKLPEATSVIATKTGSGCLEDVRIYCPRNEEYLVCFKALRSVMEDKNSIYTVGFVNNPADAHLEMVIENRRVVWHIIHPVIRHYGLSRLLGDVVLTTDRISPVLRAAAHFFWALNLTKNNPSVMKDIKIEIYKLKASAAEIDEFGQPLLIPDGPDLCQDNTLDIVVEGITVHYGIKLTNNSAYDLYPNVFYLDNSDLDIASYFQCIRSGKTTDPPLKKNGGTLTLGYGPGGSDYLSYYLKDQQHFDVGFIKIFLSTSPVDLSMIPQQAPFGGSWKGPGSLTKPAVDLWGTILMPILQRRHAALPSNEGACLQCGPAAPPGLDPEYLKVENDDLRFELSLHHEAALSSIQELDKKYQAILEQLERGQAELAEITRSAASEQRPDQRKPRGQTTQSVRTETPSPSAPPHHAQTAAPQKTPPRKLSLSERVKRLFRIKK